MARKTNKKVIAEKVVGEVVDPVSPVLKVSKHSVDVDPKKIEKIPDPALAVPSLAGQSTDRVPDVRLVLSVDRLGKITKDILNCVSVVAESFVGIGSKLCKIRDDPSLLKDCGYSDIYDYSFKELGFGRTSTKNFMEVASRFGQDGQLLDKYDKYSFTQLVELLPVSDIDSYKPEMTVSEIRNKKVLVKAQGDRESFMFYFHNSFVDSFEKVGFTDVTAVSIDPGMDDYDAFFGVFQLRASFLCGGYKCSGVAYFKDGGYSLSSLKFGSSLVSGSYWNLASVSFLAKETWKHCSELYKEKVSSLGSSKKKPSDSSASKRVSAEASWLKLSADQKEAAVMPSAVSNFLYDKAPFFMNSYLDVRNVGLAVVSPDLYADRSSSFKVFGHFVPDLKDPKVVVCDWLCFAFVNDDGGVSLFEVSENRDMNVSGICSRLDAIAREREGIAAPKGGA